MDVILDGVTRGLSFSDRRRIAFSFEAELLGRRLELCVNVSWIAFLYCLSDIVRYRHGKRIWP